MGNARPNQGASVVSGMLALLGIPIFLVLAFSESVEGAHLLALVSLLGVLVLSTVSFYFGSPSAEGRFLGCIGMTFVALVFLSPLLFGLHLFFRAEPAASSSQSLPIEFPDAPQPTKPMVTPPEKIEGFDEVEWREWKRQTILAGLRVCVECDGRNQAKYGRSCQGCDNRGYMLPAGK